MVSETLRQTPQSFGTPPLSYADDALSVSLVTVIRAEIKSIVLPFEKLQMFLDNLQCTTDITVAPFKVIVTTNVLPGFTISRVTRCPVVEAPFKEAKSVVNGHMANIQ